MNKLLLICIALLLTGCATTSSQTKVWMPTVPEVLLTPPQPLNTIRTTQPNNAQPQNTSKAPGK